MVGVFVFFSVGKKTILPKDLSARWVWYGRFLPQRTSSFPGILPGNVKPKDTPFWMFVFGGFLGLKFQTLGGFR